jgi:ATP-binding cassette subfamily B protein
LCTSAYRESCRITVRFRVANSVIMANSQSCFGLGLSLSASMISRIAKKLQDYFTNIIIQRTGAQMYTQVSRKHYNCLFKILKINAVEKHLVAYKVKSDCEKYITLSISLVFKP